MTRDDAFEKLTQAAELVREVYDQRVPLGIDMLGRCALIDAVKAVDRSQEAAGRALRARAVRQ